MADEWRSIGIVLNGAPRPTRFVPDLPHHADPAYPAASVWLDCEVMDKRDPLNPNPQAGSSRIWVVRWAGGEQRFGNEKKAKTAALLKHAELIRAEQSREEAEFDAQRAVDPTFGSF